MTDKLAGTIETYRTARHSVGIVALLLVSLGAWQPPLEALGQQALAQRPNVVIILADDLGYGDVQALNSRSTIPTPNLNQFASEGCTFLDAHSPSAVCTPTRYGVLTGRYSWRTAMKRGVLGGFSPPLIASDRPTLASLLKGYGYRTGASGKWHLGMTIPMVSDEADRSTWTGDPGVDFDGTIEDGPLDRGFDWYFGVSASLDMSPYVYIRDNRFDSRPTLQQPAVGFPHFVRPGPRSEDFVIDACLDRVVDEACLFLRDGFAGEAPCFLYLPLTAPHKPTQPKAEFRGTTGLGEYGDFIAQVDDAIGRVLKTIEETGEAQNTFVVITSDNGSYMFRLDDPNARDHTDDATIQGFRHDNHTANGDWRGTKADIYEAGHHVPFFVRWPDQVGAGTVVTAPVCHVDLYATIAEIVGHKLDAAEGEDSYSWLPAAQGKAWVRPAPIVHQSGNGSLALRDGDWKLIATSGSGGRAKPIGKMDEGPFQLYNLASDPREQEDVAAGQTVVVERLTNRLEAIRNAPGTRVWLSESNAEAATHE